MPFLRSPRSPSPSQVGDSNMLLGLDQRSLDEILQFLVDNNFNAIRIPFSTKWALDYDSTVRGSFRDGDIDGQLSRRAFLNKVISRAADFKLLVMLDSHRKYSSLPSSLPLSLPPSWLFA